MGSSAVTFVVCLLFKLCCCMYSPVSVAVLPTRVDNTSVLLAEVNIALLVEIGLARRHAYSMQVLYSEQSYKVPRSEKAGGLALRMHLYYTVIPRLFKVIKSTTNFETSRVSN